MSMTCTGGWTQHLDAYASCGQMLHGDTRWAGNHVGSTASDHMYGVSIPQAQDVVFDSCGSSYDTW